MKQREFKYYPILLTIIVAVQMMCFFLSKRQIEFFGLAVNGSGILFPLDIYLFEVIGYCYGYEYSRQAVWVNILTHVGFFALMGIIRILPYASGMHPEYVTAYKTIFQFSHWMIIGSIIGEMAGDFFSAVIVPKSKVKFQGKHVTILILIVHLISSFLTVAISYIIINIPDGYTIYQILNLVTGTMIVKTIIAIIMLPVGRKLIDIIRVAEGVEIFDSKQNYSLFKFNPDFEKLKMVKFKGKYDVKKNLNN
jgi:uncharacterized PurR-regulated membrane protein YhhQ (DUF165 family)